jgi:hypothetical protein
MEKKAFIRDGALVLYFDAAENPVVARLDLESLAQANFEVVKREPNFVLMLKDFSGQEQVLAQFAAKADAHQALYAILQALLEHQGAGDAPCAKKSSGCGRFFKWVFWILGILAVAFIVLLFVANPVSHDAPPEASAEVSSAPSADSVPEGEAMDLDAMLEKSE